MTFHRSLFVLATSVIAGACTAHESTPTAANPSRPATLTSATSTPAIPALTRPPGLAPAGLCGIAPYISTSAACSTMRPPTHVVAYGPHDDAVGTERALARASALGLAAGYPLALALDDLPVRSLRGQRGLLTVLGLFAERADAEAFHRQLPADARLLALEVGELQDYWTSDPNERPRDHVVQVIEDTPAWPKDSLERLERQLNEAMAQSEQWLPWDQLMERRRAALDQLPTRCQVSAGRVFRHTGDSIYHMLRVYAPVRCDDGQEAWIPWATTNLETAVVPHAEGSVSYQVANVTCDQPLLVKREKREKRPPVVAIAAVGSCGP